MKNIDVERVRIRKSEGDRDKKIEKIRNGHRKTSGKSRYTNPGRWR